jgi:O-antigen ligase
MVVTTGRGALLGGVAAVVALAGWCWREIRPRVRVVAPVAGILLVLVVGSTTALLGTGRAGRDSGDLLATGEGTTASLRVELWRTSWRMAQENPVFGVGPDAFGRSFDAFRSDRFLRVYGSEILATDPHNLFMSQLAGQGFPGLVALLLLLGSAVVLLKRARRRLGRLSAAMSHLSPGEGEKALLGGVCAALLAYMVQAMFNRHDMVLDFCFWVLLGLACALGRSGEGLGTPASGKPQVS